MPDFRCPSCGGGFPATEADDGCPWCGEAMDGGESVETPSAANSVGLAEAVCAGKFRREAIGTGGVDEIKRPSNCPGDGRKRSWIY